MLPRIKCAVLKSSEVEEYKRKAVVGHWVLVEDELDGGDGGGGDDDHLDSAAIAENVPMTGLAFAVDSVAIVPGDGERFLDVSDRGYVHADDQDFAGDPFDRVTVVNADGNQLRLASFRTFQTVWRLSLRRNHLESVEPIDGDLANTLICLDVSENRLSPDDIYRLSTSRLKQLFVSANRLTAVPESITDYHCFLMLELLDLSDNRISCSKAFYVLSTLHNLQTLDMSTNQIQFIPYLITKQPLDSGCTDGEEDFPDDAEVDDVSCNSQDDSGPNELVYHVQHIPFVSLKTINLTNNMIAKNSSVLPLVCWPSITSITLTANALCLKKNLTAFKSLRSTLKQYGITTKR